MKILEVPYRTLFPLILLFCLIGAYSVATSVFDVMVMLIFGVLGYALRKLRYEPAPLVLAFVLGPMLERELRQALILSGGTFGVFFTRPLSAVALLLSAFLLLSAIVPAVRRGRAVAVAEG